MTINLKELFRPTYKKIAGFFLLYVAAGLEVFISDRGLYSVFTYAFHPLLRILGPHILKFAPPAPLAPSRLMVFGMHVIVTLDVLYLYLVTCIIIGVILNGNSKGTHKKTGSTKSS